MSKNEHKQAAKSRRAKHRRRIICFTLFFMLGILYFVTSFAILHHSIGIAPKTAPLHDIDAFTVQGKSTKDLLVYPKVQVNKESPIISNVKRIVHVPDEAKIVIILNQHRTCAQPQLIGRLSGTSLSKIKWDVEEITNESGDLLLTGHYSISKQGTYFIEIIVTMCQKLNMDDDVKNICLVNPAEHRITQEAATIRAVHLASTRERQDKSIIGFWFNTLTNANDSTATPLYTRYQPQDCRSYRNHVLKRCKDHIDTARFDPYQFEFTQQISIQDDLKGKSGRLCFVGASHSGVLTQFSRMSMKPLGIQSISVRHLDYRFAANLTQPAMLDAMENCDNVVIGMGQWDASSRNEGGPTPFQEYKRILLDAVPVFVKPLLDAGISVYFRNMQ